MPFIAPPSAVVDYAWSFVWRINNEPSKTTGITKKKNKKLSNDDDNVRKRESYDFDLRDRAMIYRNKLFKTSMDT